VKISELLRQLEVLKTQFGDLEVFIANDDDGSFYNVGVHGVGVAAIKVRDDKRIAVLSSDYSDRWSDAFCQTCEKPWGDHVGKELACPEKT